MKRSEGRSSVAKAAYHARCRITDERTGDTYDYSRRTDLCGHFILAPVNAPEHIVKDSTALWNEVERVERQQNGQTARYFDVAIPAELNNDDKKRLVLEYCQKNFVEKGMIADIAFHDLDSDNPHAHVMLTLKTIGPEGFGKKDRSWNDKKIMIQWRESWATMSNSYLETIGSEERIDHRSLRSQCADAIRNAESASSHEEKAIWLAKATETNRPAMHRIHRAKWNDKEAQEQRAAEQALRNLQIQEAKKVYATFSELPLEIVVDVKSFTISVLPEPEEIILVDTLSNTANSRKTITTQPAQVSQRRPPVKSYRNPEKISQVNREPKPSLVIPASPRSKLKTPSPSTAGAVKRAPFKSKRKQVKPRQNGIFKRFTLLIVDFFKEKFVWTKRKPAPVSTDAEHDKRIAENYVFDEVLGIYISRAEYERRARFNKDDYKPTKEEIRRFPSRPVKPVQPDSNLDYIPTLAADRKKPLPKLRPPGYRGKE